MACTCRAVLVLILMSCMAKGAAAITFFASVEAGARIAEFDPDPTFDAEVTFDPLMPISAFAERSTADGSATAGAFYKETNPVLRAAAFAFSTTDDPTEGGALESFATVEAIDRIGFGPFSGLSLDQTTIRISTVWRGDIFWFGDGSSSGAGFSMTVGHTLGPGSTPLFTVYQERTEEGSFLHHMFQQEIFIHSVHPDGTVDIAYDLSVWASGGVDTSGAMADLGHSVWVFIEVLDDEGNPDPTLPIIGASGIDYSPVIVPEPSGIVLGCLALGGFLTVCRLARSRRSCGRRMP